MLQNPVHVVPHLALNKQIFAIPSYIVVRDSNYDNKGDE
jgi:hypothetical protein